MNTLTEYLPDGSDEYWKPAASGGATATFIIAISANSPNGVIGIYDMANSANKLQLFGGGANAGDQIFVSFFADGTVKAGPLGGPLNQAVFASDCFGYYLTAGGNTFYSDPALNPGGEDMMVAYRGENDTIQIPTRPAGLWTPDEYIYGWEDWLAAAGGDGDYQDFVYLVESVVPCPDSGATVALLGAGMLGLIALRRKLS